MTSIFAGDVGTEIILDCGVPLATATVMKIIARKQNGTKVTWDAVPEGVASIKYVTLAGDFDLPGNWMLQAYIEMPTWKGFGEIVTLRVLLAI